MVGHRSFGTNTPFPKWHYDVPERRGRCCCMVLVFIFEDRSRLVPVGTYDVTRAVTDRPLNVLLFFVPATEKTGGGDDDVSPRHERYEERRGKKSNLH
jgi:hypothetical protein